MLALISAAASATPFHDKNGVVDPKWAAYGGPTDAVDTEVQGVVLWIWGESIYLAVDPGYQHLLLTGNNIKPGPSEYDPTRYPNLDTIWRPMMKLEHTGVELRADSSPTQPFPGYVVKLPDGTSRALQPGDHISASGLYAIDYDHSPYASENGFTSSFTYHRGPYTAAHASAELHPVAMDSIRLVTWTVGHASTEVHVLHAPIYQDAYTKKDVANNLAGIGGDLVDESILTDLAPISGVQPPPKPDTCANCQVAVSLSAQGSGGTSRITYNEDENVNLYMTIHGTDLYNASMWLTAIATSIDDCNQTACVCKPAPQCIDQPALPAFCGAKINCSGSCMVAPGEPGTKVCDSRWSPDMTCECY